LLKLRSDQTDSVSVDLHRQRLNGDERLLSFGHTCGRLRSQNNQKPSFKDRETPAAVGQFQTVALTSHFCREAAVDEAPAPSDPKPPPGTQPTYLSRTT
jgi:hypothetical protein